MEKLPLKKSKEDFNNIENTKLQNIKSYGNQSLSNLTAFIQSSSQSVMMQL